MLPGLVQLVLFAKGVIELAAVIFEESDRQIPVIVFYFLTAF